MQKASGLPDVLSQTASELLGHAVTLPRTHDEIKIPNWLVQEQAKVLWYTIAQSHYGTLQPTVFKLPLVGDEINAAWHLYTYGGCAVPVFNETCYMVTLYVEGNPMVKYDCPRENLGPVTQSTWRELFVLAKGPKLTIKVTDPRYSSILSQAESLRFVDAARVNEGKKETTIELISRGEAVDQLPASSKVVGSNQTFYSGD